MTRVFNSQRSQVIIEVTAFSNQNVLGRNSLKTRFRFIKSEKKKDVYAGSFSLDDNVSAMHRTRSIVKT